MEQAGGQVEVGLVDQPEVGLEGVASVGDAVEDGARGDLVEDPLQVGVHQEVHHHLVAGGEILEPPGVEVGGGAVDVVPVG
jgi:hypothetical protein